MHACACVSLWMLMCAQACACMHVHVHECVQACSMCLLRMSTRPCVCMHRASASARRHAGRPACKLACSLTRGEQEWRGSAGH